MSKPQAPFRDVPFLPRDLRVETRPDGVIVLASRHELAMCKPHLPAYLRHYAAERPQDPWLSQRRGEDRRWRTFSFGEARAAVDGLTQGLLDLGAAPGRPLAILSGNTLEHALISLAAMQAGIPVAPISPAYSLQSTDFQKLRAIFELLEPALVFVQSGRAFEKALAALNLHEARVIYVDDPPAAGGAVDYAELAAATPTAAVETALARIHPDAVAKFMFTSGSTGAPKAVIQTHAALCVVAESTLQVMGHRPEAGMVRLDWAPWNHVFGATGLNLALVGGGAFYVDDGKPVEPLFAESLRNLAEIATTTYANVPAGYAALVPALERDEALARTFFSRLQFLSYAGARLPDDLADRLQALAVRHTGHRIPFTSGFGSTETGPVGAFVHWPTDRVGLVGLPQPGVEIKLVPLDGERFEVRLRSSAVTPGYYRQPELTVAAFDDEGFYRMGDAATFVDPDNMMEGLAFAGRLSEEFKLQTGVFVRVGALRTEVVEAAAPLLQDVVVCGEDQAFVAILAWLNLAAARRLAAKSDAGLAELNREPSVRSAVARALAAHNVLHPASSQRVARAILLDEPPSIDLGEVTDKGSINQRAVQRHRSEVVRRLFEPGPGPDVITPPPGLASTAVDSKETT